MQLFSTFARGTVSLGKVFWVGVVMSLFNPPLVGFIYALFFAFKRETRREAAAIAVWSIVWSIVYALLVKLLIAKGIVGIR